MTHIFDGEKYEKGGLEIHQYALCGQIFIAKDVRQLIERPDLISKGEYRKAQCSSCRSIFEKRFKIA